jgi:uncharacterized protein YlbG (UPF0298 family)
VRKFLTKTTLGDEGVTKITCSPDLRYWMLKVNSQRMSRLSEKRREKSQVKQIDFNEFDVTDYR